jgi:peptidoglycan/LPS O-acetylase OafA/YrhL
MKKEFSIYLDLIRFAAAFCVLIFHSNLRSIIAAPLPLTGHAHAAVIVFFVLSGYVISYVTAERENSPIAYWSSRLSRFYSLVIPVVLLTPLLDVVGESLAPHFYSGRTTHDLAWLRVLTSLTYTNEIWKLSIMSFSNVPFWSVCYEMWYYVLFAAAAFTRGRARVCLLVAIAVFIGPKMLLLFPIWILGAVLHRWKALDQLSKPVCWILFLASVPLYGLFQHYEMTAYASRLLLDWVGPQWHRQFVFSREFTTDYLLALIIAANFIGFRGIAEQFGWILLKIERPIRWLAGFTFSLYILHQPLLLFYAAVFNGNPGTPLFYMAVLASTLVTVGVIGTFTEQKRHLMRRWIHNRLTALTQTNWWRRHVTSLLQAQPQPQPLVSEAAVPKSSTIV